MPIHQPQQRTDPTSERPGVQQAEAALMEHYPHLVRLAYLVLPPSLGRHRRVLAAHGAVQRSLPARRSAAPGRVRVPAQTRAPDSGEGPDGPRGPRTPGCGYGCSVPRWRTSAGPAGGPDAFPRRPPCAPPCRRSGGCGSFHGRAVSTNSRWTGPCPRCREGYGPPSPSSCWRDCRSPRSARCSSRPGGAMPPTRCGLPGGWAARPLGGRGAVAIR